MEGSTLRVATVIESPLIVQAFENGQVRLIGGYEYDVLQYIKDSFNLSITVLGADNYAPAMHSTSSNLSDIATMINNDDADISISVHEFNIYRASRISYLHPTFSVQLFGFFIQPPKSYTRNMYFQPFKIELWIAMLCTWVCIVITIATLIWTKNIILDIQPNELRISEDILVWALAAGCQHGWLFYPESVSIKIAFFSGLLTSLIIYLSYSATLVSVLSLDVIPIKNVADMFSAKYNFFGSNLVPGVELFMQQQQISSAAVQKNLISPKRGAALISNENTIFMDFDNDFYSFMVEVLSKEEICSKISKIAMNSFPSKNAMLVKKGSIFKEKFNKIILWMINTGILHRLRKNHDQNTILYCLPKSHHQNDALDFNDILPSLFIFLFIDLISLICFILENIICSGMNNIEDKEQTIDASTATCTL